MLKDMKYLGFRLLGYVYAEKYNVLTPANWKPGQDVMIPSPKTSAESDKLTKQQPPDLKSVAWYMWFKKLP
jgi:hypothetical protein